MPQLCIATLATGQAMGQHGVHPRFSAQPASESVLAGLGIHSPYVLHVGGCSLRRNLAGLVGAWPRVRDSHPQAMLVLVGPRDTRRDRLFERLDGAVLLGGLTSELPTPVLAAASVIVVPSVYEGFGIPVLEGMAAGVAVVAAARSSLPEVCGDAAILVEPSAQRLAAGLIDALDAGSDISDLISRGRRRSAMFTWDESVRSHAAIWRSVA